MTVNSEKEDFVVMVLPAQGITEIRIDTKLLWKIFEEPYVTSKNGVLCLKDGYDS